MIRILSREYNSAVAALCEKLDKEAARYDVYISQNTLALNKALTDSIKFDSLVLVGDVGKWCVTFSESFSLSLFYDKFAEKHIREYCKLTNLPLPAQYWLDKYCSLPETFIHYSAVYSMQCACCGEYQKCHVYILPDEAKECVMLFDNYIKKDLFKSENSIPTYHFKLFGISQRDLSNRLSALNLKCVSQHCETTNLDSKVTLCFARNLAKKIISENLENFKKEFQEFIYSDQERTLAETVVSLLNERYKTVATAESITGGLIASSIVDVPGASNVLYEGAVTYTIDSKCRRLGLNPHFIDQYGVVSIQVAKSMALSQLENADFSVSTTGFAGPTADGKHPVGLCYIAVGAKMGSKRCVKVFKNIFIGDRNAIRNQVANTAMYLLINAVTNTEFFTVKKPSGSN